MSSAAGHGYGQRDPDITTTTSTGRTLVLSTVYEQQRERPAAVGVGASYYARVVRVVALLILYLCQFNLYHPPVTNERYRCCKVPGTVYPGSRYFWSSYFHSSRTRPPVPVCCAITVVATGIVQEQEPKSVLRCPKGDTAAVCA